jgi:hypothetical protein
MNADLADEIRGGAEDERRVDLAGQAAGFAEDVAGEFGQSPSLGGRKERLHGAGVAVDVHFVKICMKILRNCK